ncbi:hypothetical protein HDU97_005488 [Phlyctochytrium planicorne]|nr:hypothetical protein HDU97_005488 [Phlyctochytrium planicorne]
MVAVRDGFGFALRTGAPFLHRPRFNAYYFEANQLSLAVDDPADETRSNNVSKGTFRMDEIRYAIAESYSHLKMGLLGNIPSPYLIGIVDTSRVALIREGFGDDGAEVEPRQSDVDSGHGMSDGEKAEMDMGSESMMRVHEDVIVLGGKMNRDPDATKKRILGSKKEGQWSREDGPGQRQSRISSRNGAVVNRENRNARQPRGITSVKVSPPRRSNPSASLTPTPTKTAEPPTRASPSPAPPTRDNEFMRKRVVQEQSPKTKRIGNRIFHTYIRKVTELASRSTADRKR